MPQHEISISRGFAAGVSRSTSSYSGTCPATQMLSCGGLAGLAHNYLEFDEPGLTRPAAAYFGPTKSQRLP